MSITAVSSTAPAMPASQVPETVEGRGPDRDGDADDKGASLKTPSIAPAIPQGMGSVVNTKA
jgi:hypothetical protein